MQFSSIPDSKLPTQEKGHTQSCSYQEEYAAPIILGLGVLGIIVSVIGMCYFDKTQCNGAPFHEVLGWEHV
ncbi:MAG: hypothetical protein WBJ81_05135 [Rickettsiales bacterium]